MKEVLPEAGMLSQAHTYSARWYKATTLAERIPSLQKLNAAYTYDTDRAKQRLERWKSQPPFHKSEQSFAQRLALDGLTEENLLTLLAQPGETIQTSFATR